MHTTVCVVYAALMVLSGVGSILGNLALLLVVVLNKELRTETLGLTLSFSLSDLALGLSTIPFGVHNSLSGRGELRPSEGPLCQGSGFVFLLLQMSSIHSLTWATVDKFTEICFALSYRNMCTARRTRLVLALVWLYCLLNASLPLMGFGSYAYSATKFICAPSFSPSNEGFNVLFVVVGIVAPILLMCCLYGYMVYIARKQVRRGTFMCNDQHCFYVPANNYFKSSMVMVATAVCLLVCWLPYITVCFYETFTGRESPAAASAFSTWLVLSTAALNPWVSSMSQTRYRSALRRSLSKLRQVMCCSGKPSASRPQSTAIHLSLSSYTARTSTTSRPSIPPPPQTPPPSQPPLPPPQPTPPAQPPTTSPQPPPSQPPLPQPTPPAQPPPTPPQPPPPPSQPPLPQPTPPAQPPPKPPQPTPPAQPTPPPSQPPLPLPQPTPPAQPTPPPSQPPLPQPTPTKQLPSPRPQPPATQQSEIKPNESLSAAPVVSKQTPTAPNISTLSSSSSPPPSPSSSPWNNPEAPSSTPTTASSPLTQAFSPSSSSSSTLETKATPSPTSPPKGIKQEGKPIESIELTQRGTLLSSSSSSPIKDTGSRTESCED